jgi:hypothetical protein
MLREPFGGLRQLYRVCFQRLKGEHRMQREKIANNYITHSQTFDRILTITPCVFLIPEGRFRLGRER